MTDINKKFSQDDELSEFTDRVLKGQMKHTASDSDEEMRGLEETILRLHNNMPSSSLEESTKKQMLVRLNARIRREKEQPQKMSFWASLFSSEWIRNPSRPQFAAALGIIALVIAAVVVSPALSGSSGGSTIIGTALSGSNSFILPAVLLGLIVLILWLKRRR
jgi:hypothetical protein